MQMTDGGGKWAVKERVLKKFIKRIAFKQKFS